MSRHPSKRPIVHRDLRFDQNDHQTGADVRAVQAAINKRIAAGNLPFRHLVVDGDAGRQTIAVGREVARALGLLCVKPGLSRGVQAVLRRPELRTPAQRKRAKTYTPPARKEQSTVNGNTVTGGTVGQRVVAAAMHAVWLFYQGKSHRFYSQPGRWTVDHAITGEKSGERSDCSQFVTGMHHSAGAPDPNGQNYTGGFTGTLGSAGTYIRREDLKPGYNVLYGPPPHHHVEEWVGNGDGVTSYRELDEKGDSDRDRTVGHGSPPVDYGDIDMIADPHFSRPKGMS